MLAPARVSAALQCILGALTAHIVQQDGSGAGAEVAAPEGTERAAAAQKAAHDTGVLDVPVVVTHRAPHSLVPDLNAALTAAASAHHTQGMVCGRQESKSGGKDGWVGSYRRTASQVSLVIYNKNVNTGMSSLSDCVVPVRSLSPSFSLPSSPTFLCSIHSFTKSKSLIN